MNADQRTAIAVAVVRRGDAVLIGPRSADVPLAGYWEFPGGKVLPGESVDAAAVRECLEETGLRIHIRGTCAVVDHDYDHGSVRIHFLDAVPLNLEETPSTPFRWVPLIELDRYRFPPANAAVLAALKVDSSGRE